MRRFTRKTIENISSCGFENSIALGCGGRNYLNNLHLCQPYSDIHSEIKKTLDDFIVQEDFLESMFGYELDNKQLKHRFVVKNLLHLNGIKCDDYRKLFSSDIYEDFKIFKNRGLSQYLSYEESSISLKEFACSDFIIDLIFQDEGI